MRYGIFTPTEAGAVIATYSLAVGLFVYRELKISQLWEVITEAALATATVMMIISAANALGYYMTLEQIASHVGSQRGTVFGGQFVEHRLDRGIRQMAEIGMHGLAGEQRDGFAVRPDRAVLSRPGVSDFGAGEHARNVARFHPAPHPGPRGAHRFGDVKHAPLRVATLA